MVRKISNNLFTLENVVGILLAVLIIFDLKIEQPICKLITTPFGIISSVIIAVLLFGIMHPVIGILFLIYLYQCVKKNNSDGERKKQNVLQRLNEPSNTQVEESIILERAPIKNQNQNNNVTFSPKLINVGTII
jgi:predicted membrane protein